MSLSTPTRVFVENAPFQLDRLIGRGGEGKVFALSEDSARVVKLYTAVDTASLEQKIAAMVRSGLATHTPLVAFPQAIVRDCGGKFLGFSMKRMDGYRPLHDLYSPGSRKHSFPQADYRFLVRAAANIARVIATVHRLGCVVGDINHSGILISGNATAALIDADSFQFSEGASQFGCRVGVPEYTPPELQGRSLEGIRRTQNHDSFGLAVVLFQILLMGRHPFVGTVRRGDIPPIHENIATFRYVYADGRDVGMDQPPATPSLSDFCPELSQLFDRTFSESTADARPSAEEWVNALEVFELSLVQCTSNPLHFGPKDASECAWCEMEQYFGTFLFLPYTLSGERSAVSGEPAPFRFDLDTLLRRIDAIKIPAREALRPRLHSVAAVVSSRAKEVKTRTQDWGWVPVLLFVIAGATMLMLGPGLWPLWILVAGFAFLLRGRGRRDATDLQPFLNAYVEAKTYWFREVEAWQCRIGYDDVLETWSRVQHARGQCSGLADKELLLAREYRETRRERQLRAYLDSFDIGNARIKGIGPAKIAALASYGIDTAADVTRTRLLSVPGFGEATSRWLLEWRSQLEARFVYHSSDTIADKQELARIHATADSEARAHKISLSAELNELESRLRRLHDLAAREDQLLVVVHRRIEQARVDLEFLKIGVPDVRGTQTLSAPPRSYPSRPSPPMPRQSGVPIPYVIRPSTPTTSAASRSVFAGGTSPGCPRCGGSMKQRLARRGRNAGNHFWGCARFPRCKGTRPI